MVRSVMPTQQVQVTYQTNTTNQSFRDMSNFLKLKNISNNQFFLVLYDPDLLNINPRDSNLPYVYKVKVFKECLRNFWYFIREVVRIPISGGEVGGGVPFKLNRANLAMNFGFVLNWNMFLEIPRQNGKTVSALCWYLWLFLFGTRNSTMLFLNKKHEASKENLQTLKNIRASLPDYLRLDGETIIDGKKVKTQNSTETMAMLKLNNRIKTAPAARNKALANNLGRGMTVPFLYFDEYAFIPFNYIIYSCAAPAFSAASKNARTMGSPYGILITTTPGDMLTAEGKDAYDTKNMATPFSETWYDLSFDKLLEVQKANTKSKFVYIKFNYKQLGRTEEYFMEMVKELKSDMSAVRREILLEWAESATDSPFDPEDLEVVKNLVKSPIREMQIYKPAYIFKVYKDALFYKSPPIIGVDVAGGLSRDSTAITIIDTNDTSVCAVFNCNFIQIREVARLLEILVRNHMPNAIVNIERNGGFGASLLQELLHTGIIKNNLYFEIKDKIFEERYDGMRVQRTTKKVKAYGLDQTHTTRTKLMEILAERIRNHKDKFNAQIISDELFQLTTKKNGRIEHCDNGHDDTIFSMLLAYYVWYEGKDLMTNFRLKRKELKTDDDEGVEVLENVPGIELVSIESEMIIRDEDDEKEVEFNKTIKKFSNPISRYKDYMRKQENDSIEAYNQLLKTNAAVRKMHCEKYNEDESEIFDPDEPISMADFVSNMYDGFEEEEINVLKELFDSTPIER